MTKEIKCVPNDNTYNYENLVNAVISNAAEDYRRAKRKEAEQVQNLKKYACNPDRCEKILESMRDTKREIRTLEKFFRESEWFGLLPTISGEYILNNIKREFAS